MTTPLRTKQHKQHRLDDDPLWYKDSVIYELHVKAFFDGNNDGIGDFAGLTQKLDYLEDLGVTALWLLPFYPSPGRDDGYDISDYRNIHPDYGTMRDFRQLVREAHRRGMRVITELVVNHTSDEHRWFQQARRAAPRSARRSFYVWSSTDKKFPETRVIFCDTEKSNWSWDPAAGAYYWHRFYSHQPDLNHNNPRVVEEVIRIMRYWLDIGVDGLRLDAVPYLCVREGTNNENLPETHQVLKRIRAAVDKHYSGRMLLAEANQWPDDVCAYFGSGDECHMAFHFPVMPRMFIALRKEDRDPIVDIIHRTPEIPESSQWAIFLRNHDELTLEMVTSAERDYMYQEYAADPRMRLNLGIRRRLAPLLGNSLRQIELLNSLLFSFPGTPVLYYGDEIGMGDNIFLGDRNGVRTPMQWSPDRNAGFSRADPARLYSPVIMDPVYGYQAVNVEAQERAPNSLLHFMKRIISLRGQFKAFGRGSIEFLFPANRKVLVYLRQYREEIILCIANLARSAQPVELDLRRFKGYIPVELFGKTEFPRIGELPYFFTLGPHAFYWFQLQRRVSEVEAVLAESKTNEAPVIRVNSLTGSFFEVKALRQEIEDALEGYILAQPWQQSRGRSVISTRLKNVLSLGRHVFLVFVTLYYDDDEEETFFLPLRLCTEKSAEKAARTVPQHIIALLRTENSAGALVDALFDPVAARALLAAVTAGHSVELADGASISGRPTSFMTQIRTPRLLLSRVAVIESRRDSTWLDYGRVLLGKVLRQPVAGLRPEVDIGRFLTEKTTFRGFARTAGWLDISLPDSKSSAALIVLSELLSSDGNAQLLAVSRASGWYCSLGQEDLQRVQEALAGKRLQSIVGLSLNEFDLLPGSFGKQAAALGEVTARLHEALAATAEEPRFYPEPLGTGQIEAIASRISARAHSLGKPLFHRASQLPDTHRAIVERLLPRLAELGELARVWEARLLRPSAARILPAIRCPGHLQLSQFVRRGEEEFLLYDLQGDARLTMGERRHKYSPLQDVAGLLYSMHSAAYTALETRAELQVSASAQRAAAAWTTNAWARFLQHYLRTALGSEALRMPEDSAFDLLNLLLLEKELFDLEYQLSENWLAVFVPAAALSDHLQRVHLAETAA